LREVNLGGKEIRKLPKKRKAYLGSREETFLLRRKDLNTKGEKRDVELRGILEKGGNGTGGKRHSRGKKLPCRGDFFGGGGMGSLAREIMKSSKLGSHLLHLRRGDMSRPQNLHKKIGNYVRGKVERGPSYVEDFSEGKRTDFK